VEANVKNSFLKIVSLLSLISSVWNPVIAQRWLYMVESLAKIVKIPKEIMVKFDSLLGNDYFRQAYQLQYSGLEKPFKKDFSC
jgi:hypothetical protein